MRSRDYFLALLGVALLLGGTEARATNRSFSAQAATGTEYVTFWSGDLRIFAQRPGTDVELIDVATGATLPLTDPRIFSTNVATNPFVLASIGDSFEGIGGLGLQIAEIQVRIEASEPVIVWTGSLSNLTRHPGAPPVEITSNPWGSYIPAFSETALSNGTEVGREFLGFATRELRIIALKDPATPTRITVDDLATNTDTDSDDNFSLTAGDAVFADSEIEVYVLDGFEDDTVRVVSNVDVSVLAGFGLSSGSDWTATPPSYAAGDDGSELGTLFYTFVRRSLTVFPTQDNTTVTITDLSDGDDSITVLLVDGDTSGDYQLYTATLASTISGDIIPRTSAPAVDILHNGANAFDDDFVKVESDKPVLVCVGPVASDVLEFSDVAFAVPTGPDSRIIYCYAQNGGGSNDLQIFGFDPDTEVTITSLSFTDGFIGTGHHDAIINPGVGGPGGWLRGTGFPDTTVWWGSNIWNAEILRIESNKPITVFSGDYDRAHFGAFIPFVLIAPTLPPVAVASAAPLVICPGESVTLDGSQSFDQDTVQGGQPVRYEWDFDVAIDADGDSIPDNDLDATGPVVMTTYSAAGPHTAKLTFFDDDGETDTDFVTVTVDNQGCVCPLSQGYWKNHASQWPFGTLVLGVASYTQDELLALLETPVQGDASLILSKQLIAAKLNIENGSDPGPASGAIANADSLLAGFAGKLPYGERTSTSTGHAMTAEAGVLDDYNNALLTPTCVPTVNSRMSASDRAGSTRAQPLKSSEGGGCALGTVGPMPLEEIFGAMLPLFALALVLLGMRLRRRPRAFQGV
ncbi:MAG: PKD domain-containing protein [Planctomycetota bacterium]|nr:PKD domain-containing protein [Planctomycetota bacterium]